MTQKERQREGEVRERDLAQHYLELYRKHSWQPLTQMKTAKPVFIKSAQGCWLEDFSGKKYLDAGAGFANVNLGWGQEEIAKAMYEKAAGVVFLGPGFVDPDQVLLAEKLTRIVPQGMGLSKVFFQSGGSEANEAAFKMARQYHKQSGHPTKFKVISHWMGYHGATAAALSASGRHGRRVRFEPLVPGFIHAAPPFCYRCFFELKYPSCGILCARDVARIIELEDPETVSAFIAEPMSGSGGQNIPPPEYFEIIGKTCKENQVLLILDEIITGFGRTGKMFATSHYNVRPDVLVVGKGLTGGYAPLSAVVTNETVFNAFFSDRDNDKFDHVITYGGNPVSCAAALKAIEIMERDGLVERSRVLGEYLGQILNEAIGGHPLVAFTDGRGLRHKIELVKDRATKEPLLDPVPLKRLKQVYMEKGMVASIVGGETPSLGISAGISPPLTIEKADLDFAVSVVKAALDEAARGL
ncbi:MAG: aspartate aminotransferase family protein [Chloroflexi bacterium]|nr:aspartate aminotransferase family protein [Chloroflexota bacterium]